MQYRIKYPMYRISANSPDEAKRKVVKLLDGNLNDLISIEADYSAQPTWKPTFRTSRVDFLRISGGLRDQRS
jgi:hypothetical protein